MAMVVPHAHEPDAGVMVPWPPETLEVKVQRFPR